MNKPFCTALKAILIACLAMPLTLQSGAAISAEDGKAILILDSSGSMWGRINETPKISIAQGVINDLLKKIPEQQQLGLMLYGHRRKGDCDDIELLVAPGADTRNAIADAVKDINPKGKTPLSAAVLAAADELRIEENAATVILVSDGKETCNLDPCAVGMQLEEAGIDFTAHVIGFDVVEAEDKAQLQCLAENTGGKFLTASNAEELAEALEQVSVVTDWAISVIAKEGPQRAPINDGLIWTLTNLDSGETLLDASDNTSVNQTLSEGTYLVEVVRTADGASVSLEFKVGSGFPTEHLLELPLLLPRATLTANPTAKVGSTLSVVWTGPGNRSDYVALALPGSKATQRVTYDSTLNGSPVTLTMPATPGNYELRYIDQRLGEVLATIPLVVEPVEATLDAPELAQVGESIAIEWTGPAYRPDYISVATSDAPGNKYVNYTYTQEGSPLELEMPSEPGSYEIRYILHKGSVILARQRIDVTEITASLDVPETAIVGQDIAVNWDGPSYKLDYITVAEVDSKGRNYINYSYTRAGSPLKLRMPAEAGEYEVRYILNQDSRILARTSIRVEDASATLAVPMQVAAGDTVDIAWTGPDNKGDYITVAKPEQDGRHYAYYAYIRGKSPVQLKMPAEPGDYQVRYILSAGHRILESVALTVADVSAALILPDSAKLGEHVAVEIDGPFNKGDMITVAKKGSKSRHYVHYARIKDGDTRVQLEMPYTPAVYEVRYIMRRQHRLLTSKDITVESVTAELTFQPTANVGESIAVSWDGPGYKGDYIVVAKQMSAAKKYINYQRTVQGSPLELRMPPTPGDYEIRYLLRDQKTMIGSATITVIPESVTLVVQPTAVPAEEVPVGWEGPGNARDYISIAKPNASPKKYLRNWLVRGTSPLTIKMPEEPGTYEIRYHLQQDATVLATETIVVE